MLLYTLPLLFGLARAACEDDCPRASLCIDIDSTNHLCRWYSVATAAAPKFFYPPAKTQSIEIAAFGGQGGSSPNAPASSNDGFTSTYTAAIPAAFRIHVGANGGPAKLALTDEAVEGGSGAP